jgi:hypothetical protein
MVELILVGAIVIAMGVLYVQSQIRERNFQQARNVGKQMQEIGMAVNAYIVNRYTLIGNLTNSTGTAADPGPRTCVAATNSCTITLQTLVNEGLLPTGYASLPPFNTGYTLTLLRTGVAPAWNINGLTITNVGWTDPGTGVVKYDLAGEALRAIGPDGAYTFQSTTTLSGYQGAWTESNANYPSINALGQVAVRSGSGTSMFSQFLRRDGTLPMTGALDMGGNDINNANNILANSIGTPNAGCKRTELNASGQVISRNGGCVTRFMTDPNTGQTTAYDTTGAVAVNTIHDDAASYGPLEVRRWGLNKNTGHMYLETPSGQNLYMTSNAWDNSGTMDVRYKDVRFSGDVYINGRPTPLSELLPTYSSRGAYIVSNGWGITKPTCGGTGAVPKIIVTPSIITAQIFAGGDQFWTDNGFVARATDQGTWWSIELYGWPAQSSAAWGMAHVYCYFVPGT